MQIFTAKLGMDNQEVFDVAQSNGTSVHDLACVVHVESPWWIVSYTACWRTCLVTSIAAIDLRI